MNEMVDGNIDLRSVDAMENFKDYTEEAQKNMKALQQQMDKFTNSMAMTKTHSNDLRESLRQTSKTEGFSQLTTPSSERTPIGGGATQESSGDITVNLRIDVSGVTDRSDKRALAKEISAMVQKELRSKIGGPLNQSGFSRSG